MSKQDFSQYANLSPFELKDKLIEIAQTESQRMMLNAGRGNPNFLATLPRHAFLKLGAFAMEEAERSYAYLESGFGGLPEANGLTNRFDTYAHENAHDEGISFLRSALSYVKDQLGLGQEECLLEMVNAFLGEVYPVPPRMLKHAEQIVGRYIAEDMGVHSRAGAGDFKLFATEGGTAAMTYIFQSMQVNGLLHPGDKVALGTPIFSPYLEIPPLPQYDLEVVDVRMDEDNDWQLPDSELAKLEDPKVKIFCVVNPSNPPSTKLSPETLDRVATFVNTKRPDLVIVTDDVYGTFADDFVSLFAACPRNTLCVYSFSKYFGATGWRLGVIGLHNENTIDNAIDALPEETKTRLDQRYSSLTNTPRDLRFIDRLVADSRAVALNHTAGLSTPQQLQMTLFALHGLMDRHAEYKNAAKHLIRDRYERLCLNMGVQAEHGPNAVDYYTLIDLERLGAKLYGDDFAKWFTEGEKATDFLFRLAEETGVVLLPGKGFEVVDPSARVSLANLTEEEYAAIGKFSRQVLDEYYTDYQKTKS
ncbi:MAG: bifunctional aspartate transaminase/aspartate 4-decarboxylase [Verrucomicrobiota bacterium]